MEVKTTKKTKQQQEMAKGYAFRLYMSGETQKAIAKEVHVTEATISKWVNRENWEEQKKDQNASTVTLANSMMAAAKKMSELIVTEIAGGSANIDTVTKCSDNLVKIMASAERIAKTVTKATIIDVVIALERWLIHRAETDKELTPDLIAIINKYHRKYIEYISAQEG